MYSSNWFRYPEHNSKTRPARSDKFKILIIHRTRKNTNVLITTLVRQFNSTKELGLPTALNYICEDSEPSKYSLSACSTM